VKRIPNEDADYSSKQEKQDNGAIESCIFYGNLVIYRVVDIDCVPFYVPNDRLFILV